MTWCRTCSESVRLELRMIRMEERSGSKEEREEVLRLEVLQTEVLRKEELRLEVLQT